MDIKIQSSVSNISSNTYITKKSSVSFQNYLTSETKPSITDQTLIDDKALYDELKSENNPALSNVEFGSNEWNQYKEKLFVFPPSNAPIEVKNAWREVKESISKDDREAQDALVFKETILSIEASHPENFGLPSNFKLNTIDDYETLLNNDISNNEKLKELYKNTNQEGKYTEFIKLAKNIEDKLNESLLKHQTYL